RELGARWPPARTATCAWAGPQLLCQAQRERRLRSGRRDPTVRHAHEAPADLELADPPNRANGPDCSGRELADPQPRRDLAGVRRYHWDWSDQHLRDRE